MVVLVVEFSSGGTELERFLPKNQPETLAETIGKKIFIKRK